MTQAEIIRMLREAGFSAAWPETVPNFERFAELVAAAEREACAKVAAKLLRFYPLACTDVPEAIRARGQE